MKTAWFSRILAFCVVLAMFGVAVWQWPTAPERIPIHWNIHGQVDGWSGKASGLLLLPLIGLGLFILFLVLPAIDPKKENYEKFGDAYRVMFLSLILFMAGMQGVTLMAMWGWNVDMGKAFPILGGTFFVATGLVIGKVKSNWFVGIRTPWTLSSPLSWEKTHRAAGGVFVIAGVASVLAALILPSGVIVPLMVGGLVSGSLGLVVYSYLVWKKDPLRKP